MEQPYNIHIFCYKPDICRLIKKTVPSGKYEITCTVTYALDDSYFDSMPSIFDCIILDRDIRSGLREKIRSKYKGVPVICLPSLDTEMSVETGVKYIDEPFRLSELVRALDEVLPVRSAEG